MNDLKPCPFCGSAAERKGNRPYRNGYSATVGCTSRFCPAEIAQATSCGTAEDAYTYAENVWNRRAQPDNAPLTLEELRGMDGEPVWVDLIFGKIRNESPLHKEDTAGWYIISCSKKLSVACEPYALKVNSDNFYTNKNYMMQEGCVYGETWIAYRRKPEPEGGER